MSSTSKKLRKSKEEIKREFEEYKNAEKLDKETLKDLLSHCDVIPEIIESYLNILQKENEFLFLEELFLYYQILPVETCQKYNIKKTESEKDRFFKLVKNLINVKEADINLIRLLQKEIINCDEIKHLILEEELEKEIKLREEEIKKRIEIKKKLNKNKELSQLEKEKEYLIPFKYSRWNINYCTSMDYKTEDNVEFLFYHLSNCLISEFCKDQICFKKRIEFISTVSNLIENIYPRRKEGKTIAKAFEYLCIALTNCEININFENKFIPIIDSIYNEIGGKFMNFEEIIGYLNEKNCQCEYKDKQITINYKKKKIIIDDYNLYNLNKEIINVLLSDQSPYKYITTLKDNINFNGYMDKIKNDNDLLIKIIKKYSGSKLAFSSIEKLFNIDQKEYEELFKELSENIENYICLMSYNCFFDTERTFKNPIKIIIDPYKEKYNLYNYTINQDPDLQLALKKFSNIALRKFCFEHEIHHLTTALLFFLYINEDRRLNSITKELTSDGEVIFHPEMRPEGLIANKNKNIQKEAGNLFELLFYGKILKEFTFKQLLFIANENNDNLDYKSFKKEYEEQCKKSVSELLNEFPDNQLLSGCVKTIKECIDKNPEKIFIENALDSKFIVQKDEIGETKDIYSELDDDATILVSEIRKYDNHVIIEKGPAFKNNKKK